MERREAFAALVVVQVLYGLLPAAGKSVFADVTPLAMTSMRVLGAAALFVAYHIARGGAWPRPALWPRIGSLAFFGIVVNMTLFAIGLQWTHPVNATLIIMIIPVATYLIAVLMGQESIGPRRLAGILLAMTGAVSLIGLSGATAGGTTLLGDVLILINALSFSLYLVLSRPMAKEHGAQALTVWMFVAASVIFVPIAIFLDSLGQAAAAPGEVHTWLVFIVLGPTVGAYLLNTAAIRRVSSSTVAVFIYLQTPISALAAWLILADLPSWRILPSAALILAGVYVVARFSERPVPTDPVSPPPLGRA